VNLKGFLDKIGVSPNPIIFQLDKRCGNSRPQDRKADQEAGYTHAGQNQKCFAV
jgi:hypothetical protein